MSKKLTDQAQNVLAQAQREARALNHDFVGTEHLLLGLLHDSSGLSRDVLESFGIHADALRVEIEKWVNRGRMAPTAAEIPLTPRARRVLDLARGEALFAQSSAIGSEQILLSLFREPEGVAGHLLRNLGIDVDKLRAQLLEIRLEQMKIVERAVRPLQATFSRKRKMREELLAHLTAIYEEEQARLQNPTAALEAATLRFGDPVQLSRELQSALPAGERSKYRYERMFVWRAPESAARYCFRVAINLFLIALCWCFFECLVVALRVGWTFPLWVAMRPALALLLLLPATQFVLGVLYFRMRDAHFGVFTSGKSPRKVFFYGLLVALATFTMGPLFTALSTWDTSLSEQNLDIYAVAALFAPLFLFLEIRRSGPMQIRDTLWCCLDLTGSPKPA